MPNDQLSKPTRRGFLLFVPLSVFAGVFGSVGIAAFRFLRPRLTRMGTETWTDVASLAELQTNGPLLKKIATEVVTGWATSKEEHHVYVLPEKSNQVLSAICPHEGCEVAWDQGSKRFSCPCHESYFAADGSRLTGPARRGLDTLPSRVHEGKLQVQYQSFENNATEQIKRA